MRKLIVVAMLAACSSNPLPNPDGGGTGGGVSGSGGGAHGGGSGGSGGGATAGGSGGGSVAGGSGGGSPAVDGGTCSPSCGLGRTCCNDVCVNTDNDPHNCGACFVRCEGATPYCGGSCMPTPCDRADGGSSCAGGFCCGVSCCNAGDLCCLMEGSVTSDTPVCYAGDAGTCPQGCAPACQSDRGIKRDVLEQVSSMEFVVQAGHLTSSSDPIDVHGTTLAAIQALNARLRMQAERLDRLEAENARLRAEEAVCR